MVRLHHVRGIASVSELKKGRTKSRVWVQRVKGFTKQIKTLAVQNQVFLGATEGCAGAGRSGRFLEQKFTGTSARPIATGSPTT